MNSLKTLMGQFTKNSLILKTGLLACTLLIAASILPVHNSVDAQLPTGICGPMDIAFVIDDTGSMGGAIANVKSELPTIIDQAEAASGGDLRLGLLTFKDDVTVVHELTTDIAAVENSINAIMAADGAGLPEASDIAKSNAIDNTGGFTTPWRGGETTMIAVHITDAPPGGMDDVTDPADITRMSDAALAAKSKGIRVSDVFVPTSGDYAGQAAILKADADTSEGAFITTNPDGTGTAEAIKGIIERCGEPPTEVICPALNVQHWDKIVFSINETSLARELNLTANSELDIKVLDDPLTVADLKKKVLDFLKVPDNERSRNAISIHSVEYAIACAEVPSPSTEEGRAMVVSPELSPELEQEELSRIEGLQQQEQTQVTNNTAATTNATTDDTNATGATTTPIPPAETGQENATGATEEEEQQQTTTTIPPALLE